LFATEQPGFGASESDGTYDIGCTHQRDSYYRAKAQVTGTVATRRVLGKFGLQIRDMDRSAVKDGSCCGNSTG
jgi:hypothetical protein